MINLLEKLNVIARCYDHLLYEDEIIDIPCICYSIGARRIKHLGGAVRLVHTQIEIRCYSFDLTDDLEEAIESALPEFRILEITNSESLNEINACIITLETEHELFGFN